MKDVPGQKLIDEYETSFLSTFSSDHKGRRWSSYRMRFGTSLRVYLSNVKWLARSLGQLVKHSHNWWTIIWYYLLPVRTKELRIRFVNGKQLYVPPHYLFSEIAETALLNLYRLEASAGQLVVDIGASIGDFTLFASLQGAHVYAFEPEPSVFALLAKNTKTNGLKNVRCFDKPADGNTLSLIVGKNRTIDFLKVDCEGCEYDLILQTPAAVLSKIRTISMEVHRVENHQVEEIIKSLTNAGFTLTFRSGYVYATQSR